jgi:hypothetical protein
MNQRRFVCVLLTLAVNLSSAWTARAAKPWELLIPFKRVEADQNKSYELTEEDGPWMILAASFAGPGAKQQAEQLVYELRKEFKMEAFVHKQTYDFSKPVVGLGINRYGGPKVMRHANAS